MLTIIKKKKKNTHKVSRTIRLICLAVDRVAFRKVEHISFIPFTFQNKTAKPFLKNTHVRLLFSQELCQQVKCEIHLTTNSVDCKFIRAENEVADLTCLNLLLFNAADHLSLLLGLLHYTESIVGH